MASVGCRIGEEIVGCTLWCVKSHKRMVLMSTHLIKESKSLFLGKGFGADFFLMYVLTLLLRDNSLPHAR